MSRTYTLQPAASFRLRRPRPCSRRAFSLMELMVVVGIIIVLVGLTVGVAVTLSAKSEERETQNVLTLLDSGLVEWERAAERSISFGEPGQPTAGAVYDIDATQYDYAIDPPDDSALLAEVLKRIVKNQATQDQLKNISESFYVREPDPANPPSGTRQTVKDPWDNHIRVVFPGRKWIRGVDPGTQPDDKDGTIRTEAENRYGVCAQGKIAFVSWGPDGKPGNLHLDTEEGSLSTAQLADVNRAADNLYSYDLLKDRPQP